MSPTMHIEISNGRTVEITAEIVEAIRNDSPIAVGVSGGKDSGAVAFATNEVLDQLGHKGPRVLIHADLGVVEWHDSLPSCERLAERLGWELITTRREKGDMMDRWNQRWEDNWTRYHDLSCVKLILPWSTPSMRFCTSELKLSPIGASLTTRFTDSTIISVAGIRREEGAKGQTEGGRRNAPTAKVEKALERKSRGTSGYTWHPIAHWTEEDVYAYQRELGFDLHEAYTSFGARRVSCVICIFSTESDVQAALSDRRNHTVYRQYVDLEIRSTFSFQNDLWLADVRPDLLSAEQCDLVADAKDRARRRMQAEARIPKHMEYRGDGHNSWPTHIPSYKDASNLAEVRAEVSAAIGRPVEFTNPDDVIDRYEYLMHFARVKGKAPTEEVLIQESLL